MRDLVTLLVKTPLGDVHHTISVPEDWPEELCQRLLGQFRRRETPETERWLEFGSSVLETEGRAVITAASPEAVSHRVLVAQSTLTTEDGHDSLYRSVMVSRRAWREALRAAAGAEGLGRMDEQGWTKARDRAAAGLLEAAGAATERRQTSVTTLEVTP